MRRSIFLLLVFVLQGCLILPAQKVWTLNNCIDFAIKNNLNVEASRLQKEIGQENYHQSIRNLLPSAGLNSGSGVFYGKSVDPTTYDYVNTQFFSANYSLAASVGLFSGFSKLNTIAFNKLSYLAEIEEGKQQKNEIAFDVMTHYFDVLFYQGLLDIVRKQKELSELSLRKAQVLYKTGLNAKGDILEMRSRMAQEELNVVQTENYLKAAMLDLKQTMHYTGKEEFQLDTTIQITGIQETGMRTDSVYNLALVSNPGIKAGELRATAARKNVAVAKGQLLPYVSLSGGYMSNYAVTKGDVNAPSVWEQFRRNASQSISFSLSVPLFYNWGRHSQVKLAKLNWLEAKNELDISKQVLYEEIEKNFSELDALYTEYQQTLKQQEASEVAYEVAEKKLQQGLINTIDFYDSKNVLARAESNVLLTKLHYELKRRTIDFFIGNPVYTEK